MDSKTISMLRLKDPEWNPKSRLATVSLPVPIDGKLPEGLAGIATQAVDIAWWPDSQSGRKRAPRRRMLFGMTAGELPREYRLGKPAASPGNTKAVDASVRIVDEDLKCMLPFQIGEVVFRWKKHSLALRLGIRWKKQLHWWQWLRVEELWSGPLVKAVRVGGYIEREPIPPGEYDRKETFFGSPRMHKHDWLFAEVFALCYSNGVVEVTARHINNHRFDEGRTLHDVVPVLGFVPDHATRLNETLDGMRTRFSMGSASLNLDDAAPMVSVEHPGHLRNEKDVVLFQPYEGVEVKNKIFRGGRKDGYLVRARDRRMPKGLARTVRFSFSLSDAAPAVQRLVVPEWWYGLSGDLWPDRVLPVHDSRDGRVDRTYQAVAVDHRGRFDESVVAFHWEGESPYASLLYFYRSGQMEHWRRAIRDAYHFADIAFDHSTETIRMTTYPFDGSVSPALFRTVGLTFGYLETADPYLLDCSESAATHWYWMDRHSWPRYAYGRDGASIRSLVFLWDYTGKEDYLTMAREAIGRVIQCQNPDGSYYDQGGTTGVHSVGQVIKKPWMSNLATDPILDCLLRGVEDPGFWRAVERTGDFMMGAFVRGKGEDEWPYEVSYGGGLYDPWFAVRNPEGRGKLPSGKIAHGHKARLLNVLTRRTGQAKFFETWLRFFDAHWAEGEPKPNEYHHFNKTLQHVPFAQAHCWNARWERGTIRINPLCLPHHPELRGVIRTPAGNLSLTVRCKNGKAVIVDRAGPDVPIEIDD